MHCRECSSSEVIKINKPEHVKFVCKNGHKWFEDYEDNGGSHQRPETYEVNLEDILFPRERILYDEVLREINKNTKFYTSSSAEEITTYLIDECKFNKEDIYRLFKKITNFSNKK